MSPTRPPWHAYATLWRPAIVARNLELVRRQGLVEHVPNLWQIELGVMKMWYRMITRPNSIGTSREHPVRPGWRAKLLEPRGLRLPFLLWEGSVAPWDLSGLLSSPERLMKHMLGTHHDEHQFVYDLQILDLHPGKVEELRQRARRVVEVDDRRSRWLRDLVVFEGYHEKLLEVVERFLQQDFELDAAELRDPDISFLAYLDWCGQQPATPAETLRAWREGRFSFAGAPGEAPASPGAPTDAAAAHPEAA